jgi:hypothetical protein
VDVTTEQPRLHSVNYKDKLRSDQVRSWNYYIYSWT